MSRFFQNFKSESQKRGSRAPMKPRRLATETLEDRRLLAVSPEILTALNGYESFGEYSADSVSTIEIAKNELTLDALNAAISQAASTPGDDAILIVGGGTLTFQPGDEAISIELDDATQGALTIVGYGGTFEIDANGVDRAFSIKSGTVKLGSIEISNGTADFGGAIANAGDLYLEDAILANNVATVSGGAIADKGWISVESTQILDNEATASGAAIYRGDFEFAQDENDSAPEATGTISDVSAAFGETVEIDLSQYFNEGDWTYSVKLPETLSDALAAEPTVVGNVLKLQFVAKADYSLDLDLSDVELVVAASNADGASADSNAFKVGLTDRYSSRVTAVLTSTSIDDAYDSYEVRRKGYGSDAVPSSDATSAQAPLAVQLWAEDFSDRHGLALDGDVGYTLVLRLTNATLDFDELDDLGADVYFDAFFGTIDGSDRFPNDLGPTDYIITIGYDPSEEHGTAFDATLLAHLPLIPTGDGPVSVSVEPSFDSRDPAVYRQFDGAALSVDLSQIEFVGATTAASSAAVLSNAGIAAAETTETRAAVLRDVLIAGASGGQGAIYVAASSSAALLVNATVVDNAVSGAAFVSAATGSKAVDSIFVGNGAAVSGVELQTVLTDDGAEGALAYDASKPLFADAAAGDYSLAKNAQVIDLATGSAASETDLAGNVRVSGAAADLGAYEYQGTAPAAPSDLAMSNYDGTKKTATLTWVDNADDETGYLVQSSSDGGKTWKSLTTLAANTTTRTCGGLNPGSTYMYRLAATNAYGQSEWATITFKAATAPAAPSDLAMTNYNPSTRTATLTWTDNADNETGYLVQSSSDGGKTWKSLTTLAANTTTRSCSGLNPGSTYIYRLAATNEYGQSEWATITFKASTVPAAPSDLTMTGYNPSTRTATLSWVDNADNETSYLVQSSTDGGKTWNALASLAADTTSRVCAGLYPGSTYMYRLAAENAHGQSEWATITFNAPTVPTAPSDLVLSNYDAVAGKVTMRWTDNADNETTYIVAYALVGSENWQTEEYAADATGCRFTSVDPSKSYVFRVYASNAAGDSDYIEATFNASTDVLTGLSFSSAAPKVGEELAITVAPTTANVSLQWFRVDASGQETAIDGATGATYVPTLADRGFTLKVVATGHNAAYASTVSATSGIVGAIPAAPSDLTMAGYDPVARTATLSWVDNADNETSYLVQSSTDGGKTWKSLTSLAANTTSRVCAGLYPGSTYMYRIAASNAYGQSEWATITFKASTIPAAPSDLTMAGYDPVARTATLSWVDNADNETSYLVQSSVDGGKTWNALAPLAADTTSRVCAALNPGSTYMYRIAASNAHGQSEWSTITFDAPAIPAAPSDLTMAGYNPSTRTATLSWVDNADNETSYLVQSSTDGGKTWKSLTSLAANTTSRVCAGLYPGSTYMYRLAAENAHGQSEWATIVFDAPNVVPAAPSNVSFGVYDADNNTLPMSWNDNSDDETAFVVQYSVDGDKTWLPSATTEANATEYVASRVWEHNDYQFKICARNANGDSDWAYASFSAKADVLTTPSFSTDAPALDEAIVAVFDSEAANATFQWYRVEADGSETAIEGATNAEYLPTAADVGLRLKVVATSANPAYAATVSAVSEVVLETARFQPTAPSNIVFADYDPATQKMSMAWDDNSNNEKYFEIEYRKDTGASAGQWRSSAKVGRNVEGRVCSMVYGDTNFDFRIRAVYEYVDESGETVNIYSDWAEASFQYGRDVVTSVELSTDAPQVGVEIAATVPDRAIEATQGGKPVSVDATFQWFRVVEGVATPIEGATSATYVPTLDDVGCQLQAVATSANAAYVSSAASTTAQVVGETEDSRPVPPSGIVFGQYDADADALEMSWTNNSEIATKIVVEYRSAGGAWKVAQILDGDATDRVARRVFADRVYDFRIKAVVGEGEAALESVYATASFDARRDILEGASFTCDVPTVGEATKVVLDGARNEATFQWFRVDAEGNATPIEGATDAAYVPTAADVGFALKVVATAANGAYDSQISATAEVVVATPSVPNAPTNVVFGAYDATRSEVELSWTDVSNNETGFYVEYSVDGGKTWRASETMDANETSRNAWGLKVGTSYQFRVAAFNSAGVSEWTVASFEVPAPVASAAVLETAFEDDDLVDGLLDELDDFFATLD